jgi:hypothetical protein
MTTPYWKTCFKWSEEGYELSVVGGKNNHGEKSWGWSGWANRKITLFDSETSPVSHEAWPRASHRQLMEEITEDFCKYLNEKFPRGVPFK